jgi:putative copper resistance protein D
LIALNTGVRFALYVALLPLFGLSLFGLSTPANDRLSIDANLRQWLAWGAIAALALSALSIAVMTAAMMGVAVGGIGVSDVGAMLTGMSAGTAWIVRIAALASVLAAVAIRPPATMLIVAVAGSALALASLAWTGHGAMDSGGRGVVHASADVVHLLASGSWLGGLLALAILLWPSTTRADHDLTHRALARFAATGTIAVALLILTGLVNSWLLIGIDRLPALWTSLYGRLLLIKLALFVVMLGLAASNRFQLTPALQRDIRDGRATLAIGKLRKSLAVETVAALGILGLVSWLGTLSPPISA